MSRPDATAQAALDNKVIIRPVLFAYLDFQGDPVRANNSGLDISITGNPQPDLNGTYTGVDASFIDLSPIKIQDGGSQTVTAKVSGIKGMDDDELAVINDKSRWKGRIARIWRIVWDENNTDQGTYQHIYTGYMSDVILVSESMSMVIEVSIENYLVVFNGPSNRTYINSREFDPGDASGDAALSGANGGSNGSGSRTPTNGGLGGIFSDISAKLWGASR